MPADDIDMLCEGWVRSLRIDPMPVQLSGVFSVETALLVEGEPAQRLNCGDWLGNSLSIAYEALVQCAGCGDRVASRTRGAYCDDCNRRLARCDLCFVSPERCHWHLHTCREVHWGAQRCHDRHSVYVADVGEAKIGITGAGREAWRWSEQGASAAIVVARCGSRRIAGVIEAVAAKEFASRSHYKRLLTAPRALDLAQERARFLRVTADCIQQLQVEYGPGAVQALAAGPVSLFEYGGLQKSARDGKVPAGAFDRSASRMRPVSLKKIPVNDGASGEVKGTLLGVRGPYLLFAEGILNARTLVGRRVRVRRANESVAPQPQPDLFG